MIRYHDFQYQAGSWDRPRRVVAKVEWRRAEGSAFIGEELFPRMGFSDESRVFDIVITITARSEGVVHSDESRVFDFYNGRGTAEQWIKEGKYALNWTRLSCHSFAAHKVRLSLFILAYNSDEAYGASGLGNLLRRLALPKAIKDWSLRSVQVRIIKMGGRFIRHARRPR